MRLFLLLLAMAAPALSASGKEDFASVKRAEMEAFAAEAHASDQNISQLGTLPEAPFQADAPMPQPEVAGQTVAVADGGLYIDHLRSIVSYIGNVRLNDSRGQLRAAQRLFIRFPEQQNKGETLQNAHETAHSAPAAAETAASPSPSLTEEAPPPAVIPVQIMAENAAIDMRDSKLLLEGRLASPSLTLTRGSDSVVLHPERSDAGAAIYCNPQGDLLILGSEMTFRWHNSGGEEWVLKAAAGPIYYIAAERRLIVEGKAQLSSPQGEIESHEKLSVIFTPTAQHKNKKSPFQALTNMQFKEIESAHAEGNVTVHTSAEGDRQACTATGETLHFNASTGESLMTGSPCLLTYGDNSLKAYGSILMEANGNARIESHGEPITGAYTRPGEAEGEIICGTFSTPGPISFIADDNRIYTPSGLTAKDALSSFSCTGEAMVYLTPAKPPVAHKAKGLPNLAIAQMKGIWSVLASGNVELHSKATASTAACDAEGETLYAHISSGEVMLGSKTGKTARARYGDYELTAHSDQVQNVIIHLNENGDITASGDSIHATLPSEKGNIDITCTNRLHLNRAQATLTLGEHSRISSPDGIMTAKGPLTAELAIDEAPRRTPKKYPHLSYNYSGLHRATTPSGGTLRTTQVSMQFDGSMELEMKDNRPVSTASARDSIRTASARKRVILAGKDAGGRLVRASGDRLDFDSASGNFYLRGSTVTLADQYNTHTASGAGACVTIDPKNNIRITGERQSTTAHHIHDQMDRYKNK